jgi:HEAT repeat protein
MIPQTQTKNFPWKFILLIALTGALATPSFGFAECQIATQPWEPKEPLSCIEVLENPSNHGREKTYRALKTLMMEWEEKAFPLIVRLISHKEPDFQRMALKTFKKIQTINQDYKEALETKAIEALAATNSEVRATAAQTLAELGTLIAEQALINLGQNDNSPSVIAWAATALGEIKSKAASNSVLLNLLKSPEPQVRYSAVRALGEINNPVFIKHHLPPLLNDPYIPIKMAVCETLGNSGDRRFYQAVANQTRSSDTNIYISCLIAATKLDAERSLPFLVKLMADENREIRLQAIYLLGGTTTKEVARLLGKTLKYDSDSGIRYTAASLLGGMVFKESFKFLNDAINDPNIYVLSYSAQALKNLGKRAEDFEDPEKREQFIQQAKTILAKYANHHEGTIQCKASIELAELGTYKNLESFSEEKFGLCNPQDKCRVMWLLLEQDHQKGTAWAIENREWIQAPGNCPNLGSKILTHLNQIFLKTQ